MRRRRAQRREIIPDPKYRDLLIAKFINMVMRKGKRSVSEKIVYGALDAISKQTGNKDSLDIFKKAIENVKPRLEVKPRRIGGATYQVPVEVATDRGNFLAMMWIRNVARSKKGRPMREKLAAEIMDAYNRVGTAIKKREDMHRMAEANKAFAHYRW